MSSSAVFAAIDSSSDSTSAGFESALSSIAVCCLHKHKNEVSLELEEEFVLMEAKWSEAEQQAADAASTQTDQTVLQTTSMNTLKPSPFVMVRVEQNALLTASLSKSEATAELHKQHALPKPRCFNPSEQAVDSKSTRTDQPELPTTSFSTLKPVALVTSKVEGDALSTASASVVVPPSVGTSEPDQEPEAGCSARSTGNIEGTSLTTPQKVVRQARNRRFSQAEVKTTNANVQLSQQWLGA